MTSINEIQSSCIDALIKNPQKHKEILQSYRENFDSDYSYLKFLQMLLKSINCSTDWILESILITHLKNYCIH